MEAIAGSEAAGWPAALLTSHCKAAQSEAGAIKYTHMPRADSRKQREQAA